MVVRLAMLAVALGVAAPAPGAAAPPPRRPGTAGPLAVIEPAPPAFRPDRPERGHFLIATPAITGPTFAQTVVLLLAHGSTGSVGLIVNRPTSLPLRDMLPDEASLRGRDDRVHLGGPVAHGELLLLVRSDAPPPDSRPVLAGVHVTASVAALREAIAAGATAQRLRAYVGYAGWAPGQLAAEIARGDWTLAPGEAELVFHDSPDAVWPALRRDWGGRHVRAPAAPRRALPRTARVY
jgi:putative transcriptional regulator